MPAFLPSWPFLRVRRSSRAFTLIELLVVVAIMAVLMAILLPSLRMARDQANRSACAANLKALGAMAHIYGGENDDFFPFPNYDGGFPNSVWEAPGWLYNNQSDPRNAATGPTEDHLKEGVFAGSYNMPPKAFRCPADYAPFTPAKSFHNITSYLMNGAIINFARSPVWEYGVRPSVKISRFKSQDVLFWEVDEKNGGIWNDGSNAPHEGLTRRHGYGGASIGRMDGGAEYITRKEFDAMWSPKSAPAVKPPNRLWCAPDLANGGWK